MELQVVRPEVGPAIRQSLLKDQPTLSEALCMYM